MTRHHALRASLVCGTFEGFLKVDGDFERGRKEDGTASYMGSVSGVFSQEGAWDGTNRPFFLCLGLRPRYGMLNAVPPVAIEIGLLTHFASSSSATFRKISQLVACFSLEPTAIAQFPLEDISI